MNLTHWLLLTVTTGSMTLTTVAQSAEAPLAAKEPPAMPVPAKPAPSYAAEIKATKQVIEWITKDLASNQAEAAKATAGSPLATAYERLIKASQAELELRQKLLAAYEAASPREQIQELLAELSKMSLATKRAGSAIEARRAQSRFTNDQAFEARKSQFPQELQGQIAARAAARQAAADAWGKLADKCAQETDEMEIRRLRMKASYVEQQAKLVELALTQARDEKRLAAELAGVLADEVMSGKLKEVQELNAKILAASLAAAENNWKCAEAELDREVATQLFHRQVDTARKNAPAPKKTVEPKGKETPPVPVAPSAPAAK